VAHGPTGGPGPHQRGKQGLSRSSFSFTYEEPEEATTPGELLAAAHCAGRIDGADSTVFERAARETLERCAESHWLHREKVELRAKLL